MNPTEHIAKTPSLQTGLFALLGGLLRVKGTRASKISQGTLPAERFDHLASKAALVSMIFMTVGFEE